MKGLDPLFGGNGASAAPSQAVYMPTNVRYCMLNDFVFFFLSCAHIDWLLL